MPLLWIVLIAALALPAALHLRGAGIVGLCLGMSALLALVIAGLSVGPAWTVGDPRDVLAAPLAIYLGTAALFWALARWGAPPQPRLTSGLFWLMHLSLLTLALSLIVLRPSDTASSDMLINAVYVCVAAFSLAIAGLLLAAFFSALRKEAR